MTPTPITTNFRSPAAHSPSKEKSHEHHTTKRLFLSTRCVCFSCPIRVLQPGNSLNKA